MTAGMFEQSGPRTTLQSAITIAELVYHSIVRMVRKTHGNAVMSILLNMMQAAIFVLAFFFMFSLLGLKGAAIRGDFLLYIMSGIFLFMTHVIIWILGCLLNLLTLWQSILSVSFFGLINL